MAFLCLISCFTLLRVSSGHSEPASPSEMSISPRIINGKDANPGAAPWHVTLLSQSGIPCCAGSLINRSWVITVAHCNFTRAYRVVVGLHDLHSAGNTQELRIAQVFRHPMFKLSSRPNDIALLKLNSGVRFNSKVFPILLSQMYDHFLPRSLCKIMGFGSFDVNGTMFPNKMQEATVAILNNERCQDYWRNIRLNIMLCAGARGVSSSLGDSGGSVACQKNGAWTLAGIISCGHKRFPTRVPFVETRVSAFQPWIQQILAYN